MGKNIVIIPATGTIEFSGSSTHHNVLTVDSKSISITTDNFIIDGGNITAQNYIVSSSVTHMTQSFSSGSTIFGDTLDDTHNFTGSANITGSLTLNGDSITAGGGGSSLWHDSTTYLSSSVGVRVEGDISGSGNLFISGSGGESIFGTVSSGVGSNGNQKILIGSATNQSSSIHLYSSNVNWEIATSKTGFTPVGGLLFRYGGTDTHAFDNAGNFGVNTTSPSKTLTVNGDISGSGNYYNDSSTTPVISSSGEFFGKIKDIKNSAFYHSYSSTKVWIPLAGTTSEGTTAAAYHMMIAPYAGRLVKVLLYNQSTDPGSTTVKFWTGAYNSGVIFSLSATQEITVDMVDDTSTLFRFSGSVATFSAGERLGISVERTSTNSNYFVATTVWEYDTTDEGSF